MQRNIWQNIGDNTRHRQADIISANRKLLEDIQFRVKKLELGLLDADGEKKEDKKKANKSKEKE